MEWRKPGTVIASFQTVEGRIIKEMGFISKNGTHIVPYSKNSPEFSIPIKIESVRDVIPYPVQAGMKTEKGTITDVVLIENSYEKKLVAMLETKDFRVKEINIKDIGEWIA